MCHGGTVKTVCVRSVIVRGRECVGSMVAAGPGLGGPGVDEMDGRTEKSIDGVKEGVRENSCPGLGGCCDDREVVSSHGTNESAIAAASNETIGLKSVQTYRVLGRAARSSMIGANLLASSMTSSIGTE